MDDWCNVLRKGIFVFLALFPLMLGCSNREDLDGTAKDQQDMQTSPSGTEEKRDAQAARSTTEQQEDLDICEAVFRYQFEHNASGIQQEAEAYFLEVFAKDPSDEFLTRFKGSFPPVEKGSQFGTENGLRFRIESLKRVDKDKAIVSGGYFESGLSASGNLYTVVRQNGKWTVVDNELLWIS